MKNSNLIITAMKTRFLIVIDMCAFTTVLTAQTRQGNPAMKSGERVMGTPLHQP
jgi:hypothetical protein